MLPNKKLIESVIKERNEKNDPVKQFATRNKASPVFRRFIPFMPSLFQIIYNPDIDGVKLKFKHTTLIINGRHRK